ncbi:hypothetical protein B0H67DRAFT_550170 [Lasiosphaeris hirsuta]|uniref:Uncharacterized protein n=1 Tax=Lasiosphaeris hirsuta TaxID=260670 RepID=A0AA40AYM3_9PEZI|nr:hypothetical protein B0H67DRAFT_550170 [Lasiosphaeris hirsuta]
MALKPQRLAQILGSLHYLLAFNTEAQDCHFLVDLIDRTTLTSRRIRQLGQLINQDTNGAVQVHYTPETGVMTITTISISLERALLVQILLSVKENITGIPDFELRSVHGFDVAQYICCIDYNNKPYGLFLLANPGTADMAATSISSALDDITRNHPSIELVVRLELGGLGSKIRKDQNGNIEACIHRVAEKSRVQVWVRQNAKYFNDKASSLGHLHEGGELRLRLPLSDESAQGNTVSVLKFSDILEVIRDHCKKGVPLIGHPDNKAALQASVFPLHAFNFGFAAHITQLLGLRAAKWKGRNVESKTRFWSLSGGGALATRGIPTGLGQIKAGGSGRLIHPTTTTTRTTRSLMSLLPARRLLGRLFRR